MPKKDLTIAEKVVVLRKIREQPPNTSHRQLVEKIGVLRHMSLIEKQRSTLMC